MSYDGLSGHPASELYGGIVRLKLKHFHLVVPPWASSGLRYHILVHMKKFSNAELTCTREVFLEVFIFVSRDINVQDFLASPFVVDDIVIRTVEAA